MNRMDRSTTPDDYLKAVHQLKQFLSESDSSDPPLYYSATKHDRSDTSGYSEKKSHSARKNLFKSPIPKIAIGDGIPTESLLTELIQRQTLYIKAVEEELSLYKSEVPGLLMEMKLLISNEESCRMVKSDTITQRLFTLMDTLSSTRSYTSHDSCEMERKTLLQNLDDAKRQVNILKQQWADHVCWKDQTSSPKFPEELSKERPELLTTISKLRSTISGLQQREADALRQVQQSVEVAEQAQVERAQMETEVRRLVAVVEQHEQQITSLTADHSRRLQDERSRWEAKFADQLGTMKREKDLRDEALTRLSLDLEQVQRNEAILKNEIQIKTNLLDASRQDFQRQIGQLQGEHSRLTGQLAELQRRLGETELRSELSVKAAEQETCSARTEAEFLRRKVELLQKEHESRKQDYEQTTKELEQRNMEAHIALSQRENDRMQAVKASSQANSLVKYLEQRETTLLSSLQETRQVHEAKIKELSNIIEEQGKIIQSLKDEYSSLVKDYESCLRAVRQSDLQAHKSTLVLLPGRPPGVG